jgi:hypothetical protein
MDPVQALPVYVVHFTLDESGGGDGVLCESCERETATLYCEADNAHLCDRCDVETHSANKLVRARAGVGVGVGVECAWARS